MKFGVVIHKPTMNLGDDIQTYAAAEKVQKNSEYISQTCSSIFLSVNELRYQSQYIKPEDATVSAIVKKISITQYPISFK